MSERNFAVEYIRGIAMLGVVGIHTGAYSLANPEVNVHLFALLEIFTRFTVPIFFFVSAFGLFSHHRPEAPLHYRHYFWRRSRTVLIPYLAWSVLYMAHQSWLTADYWQWSPPYIYEHFFFGLASYQLYFLVILIWFYALMPLWRIVLPWLLRHPNRNLAFILVAQIVFNYYSSYHLPYGSDNYYLNLAFQHRMSYLVLHYVFIFLLGAVFALRLDDFLSYIRRHRRGVNLAFAITLAGMLGAYYWLLAVADYSPVQAVNTIHQLSPIGVLYTLAASLFCMALFTHWQPSGWAATALDTLSRYSYPVYLVHPLIMYSLAEYIDSRGWAVTVPVVIFFYVATVASSLSFGAILQKAARLLPLLGMLLTGSYPAIKKIKPGT